MTIDEAKIIMNELARSEDWARAKMPNAFVNVESFIYVELWPETFGIGRRGENEVLAWRKYVETTEEQLRELINGNV